MAKEKETVSSFLESLKEMTPQEMAQTYLSQKEVQTLSDEQMNQLQDTLNLSLETFPPPRRNSLQTSQNHCETEVSNDLQANNLTFNQKYEKYYANMKSSASIRCYSWIVVSYQLDIEFFTKVLEKAYHYAYIVHDKDETDIHLHFVLTFSSKISALGIFKLLDFEHNKEFQNFNIKPCTNISDRFEYLVHFNDPDKFQYDKSLIVTDNNEYWFSRYKFGESTDDLTQGQINEQFVDDLLNLSFTSMCRKYGRDFMRYANQYYRARYVILRESGEDSFETDKIIRDLSINFREIKQI